jgi:hypothetical protein
MVVSEAHMKKLFATILILILIPWTGAISVQGAPLYRAEFDLFDMRSLIDNYSRVADRLEASENIHISYSQTGTGAANVSTAILDKLYKQNFLLLPGFLDVQTAKRGDVTLSFGNPENFYTMTGNVGESGFTLICYGEIPVTLSENAEHEKTIGGIKITGEFTEWQYGSETGYSQTYRFNVNGWGYELGVDGYITFEEIFDKLSFKVYPLSNGFIIFEDNLYYNQNGKFLTGWYKIRGDIYYFREDGTAVKGFETIGDKTFEFDENGVYAN